MESKRIAIGKLTPNKGQIEGLPANPRQWTQTDIDRIARSLRETPELFEMRPCIVYPHGDKFVILGGNLRYTGAKANKDKDVPCIVMPEDTPVEKLREIVVKDNGSFGQWDYDALANEWDDLPLQDWGVPAWEGEAEPAAPEVKEDDFNEDAEVETRCNPGDIWQLGDHRLMCGDSTDGGQVALLMDGAKADICVTDPPYGIDIGHQSMGKGGGVARHNDYGENNWDKEIPYRAFPIIFEYSKNQVIWGGNYFADELPASKCWLVWDKDNGGSDFADVELAWTSFDKAARLFKWRWAGMLQEDMKNKEKRYHPTQKPIALFSWIIDLFGGEIILDLFGGSGSTLIAAEQLNRKCYMMELDPHYCDVIISRWETFTGKTAQLITPGDKVS